MSQSDWQQPIDESPFELPEGWSGGGVEGIGGGNNARIWRKDDYQVMYNLADKGVELVLFKDGEYEVKEQREADKVSDVKLQEVAEELIWDFESWDG